MRKSLGKREEIVRKSRRNREEIARNTNDCIYISYDYVNYFLEQKVQSALQWKYQTECNLFSDQPFPLALGTYVFSKVYVHRYLRGDS